LKENFALTDAPDCPPIIRPTSLPEGMYGMFLCLSSHITLKPGSQTSTKYLMHFACGRDTVLF